MSVARASRSFARWLWLSALFLSFGCAARASPERVEPPSVPAPARAVEAPLAPEAPVAPPPLVETRARWAVPTGEIDVVSVGAGARGMVLLHGYGAEPEDMVPLARELAAELPLTIAVPTAPRAWRFGGRGRAWFERSEGAEFERDVEVARGEIEAILARMIDDGHPRVLVAGFSQGASLSVEVALHAAERGAPVDALVVLSGRNFSRYRGRWPALAHLPVFVSHGRADDVIPFASGASLAEAAEAGGALTTFVPFEAGHAIPPEVRLALSAFLSSHLR